MWCEKALKISETFLICKTEESRISSKKVIRVSEKSKYIVGCSTLPRLWWIAVKNDGRVEGRY